MITYSQIRRLAANQGVSEEIMEKDYIIELILSSFAKEAYKTNWQIRLQKQIPNLPRYEAIIEELKNLINTKLLS